MPDETPQAIRIRDEAAREALVRRLLDNVTQADTDRAVYLKGLDDGRALYNPHQSRAAEKTPWEGASTVHFPMLKPARDQSVARFDRTLFGSDVVWDVDEETPEDRASAQQVERFLQVAQRDQLRLSELMQRVFQGVEEDGVAVLFLPWATETRRRTRRERVDVPVLDEFGQQMNDAMGRPATKPALQEKEVDVTVYDGPDPQYIDIRNFGTYPAASAVVDRSTGSRASTGVYCRYSVSGDQILQWRNQGIYDEKAVDKLKSWTGDTAQLQTVDESDRGIESQSLPDTTFPARQFDILELWWRYSDDEDQPGTYWLFAIHEASQTLLRACPNPYWHGELPFIVFRARLDKFGILADSLDDAIGDLQDAATAIVRQTIDGNAMAIRPVIACDEAGIDPRTVAKLADATPGSWVAVRSVDRIKPLPTTFSPNQSLAMLEVLEQANERAGGVTSMHQGVAADRQVTATEARAMFSEGDVQFTLLISRLGAGMRRLGLMLQALYYQFAGSDTTRALWERANGPIDPTQAVAGDPISDALGKSYKIEPAGVKETANKAFRAQARAELMKNIGQHPLVLRSPQIIQLTTDVRPMYALLRDYITSFEIDPIPLIGSEEEIVTWFTGLQQQAQAAAQIQQAAQMQAMGQQEQAAQAQAQESEAGRAHQVQMAQMAGDQRMRETALKAALSAPVGQGATA